LLLMLLLLLIPRLLLLTPRLLLLTPRLLLLIPRLLLLLLLPLVFAPPRSVPTPPPAPLAAWSLAVWRVGVYILALERTHGTLVLHIPPSPFFPFEEGLRRACLHLFICVCTESSPLP